MLILSTLKNTVYKNSDAADVPTINHKESCRQVSIDGLIAVCILW